MKMGLIFYIIRNEYGIRLLKSLILKKKPLNQQDVNLVLFETDINLLSHIDFQRLM